MKMKIKQMMIQKLKKSLKMIRSPLLNHHLWDFPQIHFIKRKTRKKIISKGRKVKITIIYVVF